MTEYVGLYLKRISEALDKRMDAQLRAYGLTNTQAHVLAYLRRRKGESVTLKDVEQFLGVSHATVSGVVRRLQKNGYLAVCVDETDKRARNLTATRKEEEFFETLRANRQSAEDRILQGFDARERAQLSAYLQRIYENVKE